MASFTGPNAAWPAESSLTTPTSSSAWSDGAVRCIGYALLDERGRPARSVGQGQTVRICAEIEVIREVGIPATWVELRAADSTLIHGRHTFANDEPPPKLVPGDRCRVAHTLQMEVGPGVYQITFGFASIAASSYLAYRQRAAAATFWPLETGPHPDHQQAQRVAPGAEEMLQAHAQDHLRIQCPDVLTVGFDEHGRAPYYGLARLPGESSAWLAQEAQPPHSPAEIVAPADFRPAVVHVTHSNAGSQWIARILQLCAPDRTLRPVDAQLQFSYLGPQPGRVYASVCLDRHRYDRRADPDFCRAFVVIRDLRDTLVSLFFSLGHGQRMTEGHFDADRSALAGVSIEEGLLSIMEARLAEVARIQLSWFESGHRLVRYEDLLEHDLEILEQVLLDECQLGVSREALHRAVLACRFEQLSGGRPRGIEDQRAHLRMGVAGDWQRYFTDRVKRAFKARYGGVLVTTGYERNLDW